MKQRIGTKQSCKILKEAKQHITQFLDTPSGPLEKDIDKRLTYIPRSTLRISSSFVSFSRSVHQNKTKFSLSCLSNTPTVFFVRKLVYTFFYAFDERLRMGPYGYLNRKQLHTAPSHPTPRWNV
ncbi:hypothetical protein NPIL_567051 [Nephila pilipes]|uniref:Uncharacterized protein n=1 Tax=Nephila pilipes TaxID=299642 RepID=A0A8X6P0K5_NEPPI|nr:hypothetical protein NPIL_567051 [Nephila pilipes]